MQHVFMNNFQLCSEINERVVQHFIHCTETHGRHVQYLKFLQTIVKAENKFIKKCQDTVMAEVGHHNYRAHMILMQMKHMHFSNINLQYYPNKNEFKSISCVSSI